MVMDINQMKKIEAFIIKVFNYYNGRINKINYPAELHIEWGNLHGLYAAGRSYLPNIVDINPMVIARYYHNRIGSLYFYSCIIETIIHELFHIDQIIDYNLSRYSPEYTDKIERAVEIQTALYMLHNQQDIAEKFGICVDEEDLKFSLSSNEYGYSSYSPYYRKRYQDHLISMINVASTYVPIDYDSNNLKLYNDINHNITTGIGTIILCVNKTTIFVQNNGWLLSIQELNRFFNDNYFNYAGHWSPSIDWSSDNNEILINIFAEGANCMVTYVDKEKEEV